MQEDPKRFLKNAVMQAIKNQTFMLQVVTSVDLRNVLITNCLDSYVYIVDLDCNTHAQCPAI